MSPEINQAFEIYKQAEIKLQRRREALARVRRKTYINGTTGKVEHELPGAKLVEKATDAETVRNNAFKQVVILLREMPEDRLSRAAENPDKYIKKVAKEAIRTRKTTEVVLDIPSVAYDYFETLGVDMVDIGTKAIKKAYIEHRAKEK